MATFKIDFFELLILSENCIPPVPIARSMFFDNLTDKYYKEMNSEQRKGLFNFIRKNDKFDLNNESCNIFYSRFNPDNQYLISAKNDSAKKEETIEAFFRNDKYWISTNTYVSQEFIVSIKKIEQDLSIQ